MVGLEKELDKELKEIEFLNKGLVNILEKTTISNISHKICFARHFASEIGNECKKIREKIRNPKAMVFCNNIGN